MQIGVVGGGTMGSGIAQLAALAGFDTVVVDPDEGALRRARERIESGLRKSSASSGLSGSDPGADDVASQLERVRFSGSIGAVSDCGFVVEAVPEALELKQAVLRDVSGACGEQTLIATNTSSLSVTLLAKGLARPERVVGTHFFNPAAVMKLVEVIPGLDTSEETVAAALALCSALGKRALVVRDTPGFLVNRCARPFYGEALRLLQEGIAEPEQIDRICRMAGGFRMGPFELMDLIGNDVSLATTRTLYEQSSGEARWRPNTLQQQLVAGGRLGRKTGIGWYRYGVEPHREPDPILPGRDPELAAPVSVVGASRLAGFVRGLVGAREADTDLSVRNGVVIVCDSSPPAGEGGDGRVELLSCTSRSLASWRRPGAIGFSITPADGAAAVVELTRGRSPDRDAAIATQLFVALGVHVEWVGDAPGLVLARIAAQLINEACFAVGEGVSEAASVDGALRLGLNFPRGPLEWADEIGWPQILETLDGLWLERREERYRPAPLLQRYAWQGTEP